MRRSSWIIPLSASGSWLIVTMALMVDGRLWNYGEYQGILGEEEGPGESSNRVWHARVEFKVNPPHPLWPLTGLKTVQCVFWFLLFWLEQKLLPGTRSREAMLSLSALQHIDAISIHLKCYPLIMLIHNPLHMEILWRWFIRKEFYATLSSTSIPAQVEGRK